MNRDSLPIDLSTAMRAPATVMPSENAHYLRVVTDMADHCAVVAQDAIYTENQIKLVEKGTRIDSRLYDRLVQHKLSSAIDSHLAVENVVSVAALLAQAEHQCKTRPLPRLLVQALGSVNHLLGPLGAIILPAPIGFKLTVMREQHPQLFEHTILLTLTALFLGVRSGLSDSDCTMLASAALLHDLGVLYMAPEWRDPQYRAVGPERSHLIAHPITAMLVVRSQKIYPYAVEAAVLEHHERMDGSGYPRGLSGEAISPLGRILLLAEVVTAFYEKHADIPGQRLSLVLRLNHRKFPADLVAHILQAITNDVASNGPLLLAEAKDALSHMDALGQAITGWTQLREQAQLPAPVLSIAPRYAYEFLDLRLASLEKSLIEAGSHPRQQVQVKEHLEGDAQGLSELALVCREAQWQLTAIAQGCQRRWPHAHEGGDAAVMQWCEKVLQAGSST